MRTGLLSWGRNSTIYRTPRRCISVGICCADEPSQPVLALMKRPVVVKIFRVRYWLGSEADMSPELELIHCLMLYTDMN